jgi:serine protease Do
MKVDGRPVADSRALQLMIGEMKPGRTVRLSVVRDSAEREYAVNLGEQAPTRSEPDRNRGGSASDRALDGVSFETLTPALAQEFGIGRNPKGVLVRRVDPDSAAAQAGLADGDVILEVNRHPVATVEQLNRYITEAGSPSTILLVSRDGRTRYVVVSGE